MADNPTTRAMLAAGCDLVPEHMWDAVKRHVLHHAPTGHFLTALLSNDFMKMMHDADDYNICNLRNWAAFLYNHVPSDCYGSPEKVAAWLAQGPAGELGNG